MSRNTEAGYMYSEGTCTVHIEQCRRAPLHYATSIHLLSLCYRQKSSGQVLDETNACLLTTRRWPRTASKVDVSTINNQHKLAPFHLRALGLAILVSQCLCLVNVQACNDRAKDNRDERRQLRLMKRGSEGRRWRGNSLHR